MAVIKYPAYEIIKVAIDIEKNGQQFYREAAKLVRSRPVADRFRFFSEEEVKHQAFFEELAKKVPHKPEAEILPPDEYLDAVADAAIFQQKRGAKAIAEKTLTDQEALDIAVQVEKNAILYYSELLRFVSEKDRPLVEELVAEEKRHLVQLSSLTGEIK